MTVMNQEQDQEQSKSNEQEPAQASSKAWGEPLFSLGHVIGTVGAWGVLEPDEVLALVNRHVGGDFGDLGEEDTARNRDAIQCGARVFSAYKTPRGKVWVITEADRAVTTILLPSEY